MLKSSYIYIKGKILVLVLNRVSNIVKNLVYIIVVNNLIVYNLRLYI